MVCCCLTLGVIYTMIMSYGDRDDEMKANGTHYLLFFSNEQSFAHFVYKSLKTETGISQLSLTGHNLQGSAETWEGL